LADLTPLSPPKWFYTSGEMLSPDTRSGQRLEPPLHLFKNQKMATWTIFWFWWRIGGSNPWPLHCERSAIPTSPIPHINIISFIILGFICNNNILQLSNKKNKFDANTKNSYTFEIVSIFRIHTFWRFVFAFVLI
jgi:hypothetical protein